MSKDISERKNFQKKLKEQNDYSELLLKTIPSAVYSIDNNQIITSWNNMAEKIIGYTADEVIGKHIDLFNFHPCRENCKLCSKELTAPESNLIVQIKNKNGDTRYLRKNIDTLKNNLGEKIGFIECFDDITDKKLIEEELKRKEKILSATAFSIKELIQNKDYLDAISKCFELIGNATLVDRMYLFVNTYDDIGVYTSQILEWNFGTYKPQLNNPDLQNISLEELGDFIPPLKRNKPFSAVVRHLKDGKTKELLKSQDILSIIVLPIFVENTFWGFIGFDECKYERYWSESEFSTLSAFTSSIGKAIERDLTEKALETARENAETANMLKSQFLANMSHEIRTPMHAILGYTSLIKDIVKEEQIINYLNSIQKSGNMLLNIINDILDLSKIEAGKIELQTGYVDIRRLFADIKEMFSLKLEHKNIKLNIDIDPKIPKTILMDELRLRQILLNLVGNAVKFTDEGLINISVIVTDFNEKDNLLSLCFKVQDTGIGISEDQQGSIFNPFKQQDGQNNKKYGGTGLGLSISKRLIDVMNGSLSLISKVNEGSTFIVDVPNISIANLDNKMTESESINLNGQLISSNNCTTSEKKVESVENNEPLNPKIIEELEILNEELWLQCMSKNRVSDIKKLASLILDIGTKYNTDDIIKYAKALQSHINSFDLKNTKELLKQYQTIIELYKSKINV